MHSIVAIVVTYHPDAAAIGAIRGLVAQTPRVIIVDNSASAEIAARLMQAFATEPETFTLLFNPENLGVAAALNRGMSCTDAQSAEWVLTLDQDSRLTSDMVASMLAAYTALPEATRLRVASLSPTLVSTTQHHAAQPVVSNAALLTSREVSTAITSGNLVKRAAWQAIGGYDEKLFIDYVDHDFCFRLRQAGWLILECEGARLIHAIGNAKLIRIFGRMVMIDQHSPLRFYYITRNGFYFWHTYREEAVFLNEDKINMLKLFLKALLVDTLRRERLSMFWQGYRDFRKGRFGCYATHHSA
jgi:rhamnosyltransferase